VAVKVLGLNGVPSWFGISVLEDEKSARDLPNSAPNCPQYYDRGARQVTLEIFLPR